MSNVSSYSDTTQATPAQNRIRVLKLIRNESEITRADIILKTGLSAPTVTRIVEELLAKKIIKQEDFGVSNGGRPPQIIRFDSKNNFVIGVDIGGTFIRAAFSNLDGEFLYEIHLPTEVDQGFDGVMLQVGELIQKLLNRASSKKDSVFGIGVAVCGFVNKHTEMVDYAPVLNWRNVDVKKALHSYTDLKISVGNVANLIAQGELFYGVGKLYNSFITLNLDYGIGSGIIINREPFYGAQGYSGEIGHTVVNQLSTLKSREGVNGTLEALASGYGIKDIVQRRINEGHSSSLATQGDSLSSRSILKAAIAGDQLAREVIEAAADHIGTSIDTLIKLFNPEAITLSGGLSSNEDFFVRRIKERVSALSLPMHTENIPISCSSFGEEASLMGAFSLILQSILRLE